MENIKIVFFNVPENLPMVGELMEHYRKKDGFEAKASGSPKEVAKEIEGSGNGIVIFKVENKSDLQAAVTLLKNQRKLIRKGLVKFACLSYFKSKKVEGILQKYGCQDILDPQNLRSKTFSFKIDFWSRNVRAQLKKVGKEMSYNQSSQEAQSEPVAGQQEDFVYTPQLELESDIWVSKNRNENKRILRRYLCRMTGPSPRVGQWTELERRPGDRRTTFRFDLEDPDQILIGNEGAWFFTGSRPEFDWKSGRWSFSSDKPHLYFHTKEGEVFSKIKYANSCVEVAEDSTYALMKEEAIRETCKSDFSFSKDSAQREEVSELAEDRESGSGHWEGRGSVDDLGEDKIRGSLDHTEEDLGGHYEGEGSTDDISGDPFSGENSFREKEKGPLSGSLEGGEEELGGHYGGKSATDELERDPLAGSLKPDKKKKPDFRGSFEDDPLGGHYKGANKGDGELERDPLAGDLAPEKKKKRKKDMSGINEDDLGGHYRGGSRTENINHEPLIEEKQNSGKSLSFEEEDPLDFGFSPKKKRIFIEEEPKRNKDSEDDEPARDFSATSGLVLPKTKNANQSGALTEAELIEALDGDLTEGSRSESKSVGKVIHGAPKKEPVFEGGVIEASLNLESGELKVVLTVSVEEKEFDINCAFEDFFPNELVVTASSKRLELQTEVQANIKLEYNGKKRSVSARGKVSELEKMDGDLASVTVELDPFDQRDYDSFMDLYQDRQESIHEFVRLARGVE